MPRIHPLRRARILVPALLMAGCLSGFAAEENSPLGRYGVVYQAQCAVCHGERLEGAAQGTPLVGADLVHGESVEAIGESIASGFPEKGMPEWSKSLSDAEIKNLALYISETRANLNYADFNYSAEFAIPEGIIATEKHAYRMETIVDGLDPLPFSIAPLPDGRILLSERKRGLSIISADGERSAYIEGTPKTYDDTYIIAVEQEWGIGWMLEVALHPDYADNEWVYIHFGDRCSDCNEMSRRLKQPVSMNKLIRGRIKEGRWVDEEVIWQADIQFYGTATDLARGGRIAFDDAGHVFISVGLGSLDHTGIQDLSTPWGKTHRVYDDGRIPPDNPFVETEGAVASIWTFGHRSPQGLEFRHETGDLWGTEMGPRGGDEVNRLLPGRNYGWPLYSKGLNYDGTTVAYGRPPSEVGLDDIEQPVVDLSPSPAVSSFVFYAGDAFARWRGDILVGSLKARTLMRMELDGNDVVHVESLFTDLARVRDVEVGRDGEVLVLLENNSGGRIVRLVAQDPVGET